MMSYRPAVQESIGVTPHAMLYRDELPVPLDWVFGSPKNVVQDKMAYIQNLRGKIQSGYDFAYILLALNQWKRNYDKVVSNIQFNVDDFVEKLNRNPGPKPKWKGPFIIIKFLNPASVVIQILAGEKVSTVHGDRLKIVFLQGNYVSNGPKSC